MRSSAPCFLPCVLLFSAAILAQLSPQSAREVYEGQTVSAIDMIANPRRDVDSLRLFVAQKVGQPYSEANVKASIVALETNGNFEKVTVDVIPETSGLRLNFILEPAYYLGVIEFPEAAKYFSYTRLLQVTNFADQDPYDPGRLAVAEQALQNFLQRNGYFQAQVHAEPQIDDSLRLVNVKFSVQMGKQARIGSVEVQGPPDPEQAHLLRAVRSLRARLTGALLRPGKPYTSERIKAATALIKRSLTQQHRLASTVREDPPQYHADSNRVDVSFHIELGPVVTVRVTGARLSAIPLMSSRLVKKLIPIYSEGAVDRDLVEEGQQNLINYFQKKGFFDAQVKTDFQRQPDRISVVYEIDRGTKYKVDSVSFHGNRQISEQELLAQVTVKKSHLGTHGSISRNLLKQSEDNLQALYRDRGYEKVKVTSQVVDRKPKLAVTFEIDEGEQTLVFYSAVVRGPQPDFSYLLEPGISQRGGEADGGASPERCPPRGHYIRRD
jgi:outer membrane protein insertion porin family